MAVHTDDTKSTPRNRGNYEAPHMSPVMPSEDARSVLINRVAWGAVLAGVVIAFVTQLILNIGGSGFGIAPLIPDERTGALTTNLSLGAMLWWSVSGIIAAYFGGYAAGRLSGDPVESTAGWHGLTSWATSILLLSFLIVMGAGGVMGGVLNSVNLNANKNISSMDTQGGSNSNNTSAPQANAGSWTPSLTSTNPSVLERPVPQALLVSTIALLLGAIAAWFGGRAGTIKPTITLNRRDLH
jgi:hypothetical protein